MTHLDQYQTVQTPIWIQLQLYGIRFLLPITILLVVINRSYFIHEAYVGVDVDQVLHSGAFQTQPLYCLLRYCKDGDYFFIIRQIQMYGSPVVDKF